MIYIYSIGTTAADPHCLETRDAMAGMGAWMEILIEAVQAAEGGRAVLN